MYRYAYIQDDAMHEHMLYAINKKELAAKKEMEYSGSWNCATTLCYVSLKC